MGAMIKQIPKIRAFFQRRAKGNKPQKDDDKPKKNFSPGGVFLSTRSLQTSKVTLDDDITNTTSESEIDTSSSDWKTTGSTDHMKNAPLVVANPDLPEVIEDEAAVLGRKMIRARQLPSNSSSFMSNHMMVNRERTKRTIVPLIRLPELDALACTHAEQMVEENRVFHCDSNELQEKFSRTVRRLGENVAKGESIPDIHNCMMRTLSDRNNILDRRYTHMGMASKRDADGQIYICQIFRG